MALDLSALEEKPAASQAPAVVVSEGKPLELKLTDIEEDSDQPRKEFDSVALAELADSIKETGVKSPISVRSHPRQPNKWFINHGARRYRASLLAGKETIPAFIDETHNEYDQVIENLQRDNLNAMEMAIFVKKRLDMGEKKKEIAKRLGKPVTAISEYAALIDAPICIRAVYDSGRCTSSRTIYELCNLYGEYPAEVEAWCDFEEVITRATVAKLADSLKKSADTSGELIALTVNAAKDLASDAAKSLVEAGTSVVSDAVGGLVSDALAGAATTAVNVANMDSFAKKPEKQEDPSVISKPLLVVEYDGRQAAVLLNQRPSIDGFLHIKFEDNSEEIEVDASDCKIIMLTSK